MGWLVLISAIPILSRGLLAIVYRSSMKTPLREEEMQRETHRSMITALAGFSFTALMGLVVVQGVTKLGLAPAILSLLWSFLAYMFALNLQGYKFTRGRDMISDALMDSASLALLIAVSLVLWATDVGWEYKTLVFATSGVVWSLDHALRLKYTWQYLQGTSRSPKTG
jgi:hypothetical protein